MLDSIEHVVVLMLSGRSFDQLLGFLRLEGRTEIDGLTGEESNPFRGHEVRVRSLDGRNDEAPPFVPRTRFAPRPPSGRASTWQQLLGHPPYWDARSAWGHCSPGDDPALSMEGFVQAFAAEDRAVPDPSAVMGYYTATSVPALAELSGAFCVCNQWFSANPGSALVNRLYALAGQSAGLVDDAQLVEVLRGPTSAPAYQRLQAMPTVLDVLSRQGTQWRAFHHGVSSLWAFERFVEDPRVAPIDQLWATLSGHGEPLGALSFIEPDFLASVDLRWGQRLVQQLYERLRSSMVWDRCLLLITYDEHGGFYDHVPPPVSGDAAPFGYRGVRVPAVVVSPWIKTRSVSDTVFDHTSIIRTVLDRFCGGQSLDGRTANRSDVATSLEGLPMARRRRSGCPPSIAGPQRVDFEGPVPSPTDAYAPDGVLVQWLDLLRHRAQVRAHPVEAIAEDAWDEGEALWDELEAIVDGDTRAEDEAFVDAEDAWGQLQRDIGQTADRTLRWVERTLGFDLRAPVETLRQSWRGAQGPAVPPEDPLRRLRTRSMPPERIVPPLQIEPDRLDEAIEHAGRFLLGQQLNDGSIPGWIFEGADPTASTAIVLDLLGALDPLTAHQIANYIWSTRQDDGSFLAYGKQNDEHGRMDATATCYAALIVCGVDPLAAPMQETFRYIRGNGGFGSCTLYTQPLLVLAGVMDAYRLPVLPMSWVLVPGVSHVLGRRLSPSFNLLIRAVGMLTTELRRRVHREPVGPVTHLERKAVLDYFTSHQNPSGSWYGVLSITVLTLAAVYMVGVPLEDERVQRALVDVERWRTPPIDCPSWDGESSSPSGGVAFMAFDSRIWNTASAVSALIAANGPKDQTFMRKATMFLLEEQNEHPLPRDWQNPRMFSPRTGGWACEAGNAYGSDCDSSAVAMWALAHVRSVLSDEDAVMRRRVDHALGQGLSWIFGMQNDNGGFPTFTHGQGVKAPGPFSIEMPEVPSTLAEVISALISPPLQIRDAPTADVNGRVLQLLGMLGYTVEDQEVRRVIDFLQYSLYVNDAWWGRWISNYLAGTAEVVAGLAQVRYDMSTPWVERAMQWILRHQNDDGGWGESVESYASLAYAGRGPSDAFSTGHIVRCLCLAGQAKRPEVAHGVRYLLKTMTREETDEGMKGHWIPGGYYWVMLWPWPFYRLHQSSSIYGLWALALYRNALRHGHSESTNDETTENASS